MEQITVGVKGSGQLALMLAESANDLNVKIRSAGAESSCAFLACEPFTKDLEDTENLNEFLSGIEVFTFESEHEGLEIIDVVEKDKIPVYPPADFVEIAGDRLLEKRELVNLDIPVAPFIALDAELEKSELQSFLNELVSTNKLSDLGVVVKTRHGGYDGKGQWVITNTQDSSLACEEIMKVIKKPGCIVEGLVDFNIEVSILATRAIEGDLVTWPLTHNIHKDSILQFSYCPIFGIENIESLEAQAQTIVRSLCDEHDYVGTIAVECFVTRDGLVVNEIAPRVHNSGHWTIEGAQTSQFEQHIRAITSKPLGSTGLKGFSAMVNLVGIDVNPIDFEGIENVYLHWYSKEVREKRKVGHITVVGSSFSEREELVNKVLKILGQA